MSRLQLWLLAQVMMWKESSLCLYLKIGKPSQPMPCPSYVCMSILMPIRKMKQTIHPPSIVCFVSYFHQYIDITTLSDAGPQNITWDVGTSFWNWVSMYSFFSISLLYYEDSQKERWPLSKVMDIYMLLTIFVI